MASILHELEIQAPADSLYHSLTEAKAISNWWLAGADIVSEVGCIGKFPFSDGQGAIEMEIKSLSPNQNVTWVCRSHKHLEWLNTEVSFSIKSLSSSASLLQFRHSNWKNESGVFGKVSFYWASLYLPNLKMMLERSILQRLGQNSNCCIC